MKFKGGVILFAAVLISVVPALGQATWQYTYGGYSTDEGNSVLVNSDGNFLVVGSTGSFGAGNGDIYVLLLDTTGAKIWSTTLGGPGVEQGKKGVQTSDGGYLIAGITNSFGGGGYDGYVAKIDEEGNLLWEHAYGGSDWDFINSISNTPDGGSIVAGQTYSNGSGGGDAWVLKLDDVGTVQWERTYGGSEADFAHCIIGTVDGGYMIAGGFTTDGDQNAWLVKLDNDGGQEWDVQEGGDSLDYANSVIQTADGGYAVVGVTRSYGPWVEALQYKVDETGSQQWVQHWLQGSGEEYFDHVELPDGRFVALGFVDGLGSGGKDIYLLFTDSNGGFLAGITNGGDQGDGDEAGFSIVRHPDGGFVLCGFTESFGFGIRDVYVVKTDSLGLTESTAVQSYFDPLSIPIVADRRHFALFPSVVKANEQLHLILRHTSPTTAQVSDMRGSLIATLPIPAGERPSIRIPELAPGPYIISIVQKAQAPLVVRFVVVD